MNLTASFSHCLFDAIEAACSAIISPGDGAKIQMSTKEQSEDPLGFS